MSRPGYEILSLDDLDRYPSSGGSPVLLPLRRRLGFRPFGVNCWTAEAVGAPVIGRHSESDGDEELYVVVRGRATFTLDETTVDAPAGTLVHCPPGTSREAIATEPGTVVLAAGAKAGEAWRPHPWEDFHIAFALCAEGRVDDGRALAAEAIASAPEAWQGHYNAACLEVRAGDLDAAFGHLDRACRQDRGAVRRIAPDDDDLVPLHGDPRWQELVG